MHDNAKIARELVRLAKSLVSGNGRSFKAFDAGPLKSKLDELVSLQNEERQLKAKIDQLGKTVSALIWDALGSSDNKDAQIVLDTCSKFSKDDFDLVSTFDFDEKLDKLKSRTRTNFDGQPVNARARKASERIGKAYYHMIDKNTISVVFNIANNANEDIWMGWMDSMLQKPGEISKIAEKYGFVHDKKLIDTGVNLDGAVFSICYKAGEDADFESFKNELQKTFGCSEIK